MRGVLIKTNIDRVRLATDSEWLGAELIKVLSDDAKQHIAKKGQRGYVDTANEEGPPEEESEETGDAAVEKEAAEAPEAASAGIPSQSPRRPLHAQAAAFPQLQAAEEIPAHLEILSLTRETLSLERGMCGQE